MKKSLGAFVLAFLAAGCGQDTPPTPPTPPRPPPTSEQSEAAKKAREEQAAKALAAERERCLGPVLEKAKGEAKIGKPNAAFATMSPCQAHIGADPKAKPFLANMLTEARAEDEKVLKKTAAAERSLKKSKGVSIGMSQDDVVASSWGKPRTINRTTTANGTREQWVYDGGYLYFQDGVLRTIQN